MVAVKDGAPDFATQARPEQGGLAERDRVLDELRDYLRTVLNDQRRIVSITVESRVGDAVLVKKSSLRRQPRTGHCGGMSRHALFSQEKS